jgi:predicted nicotinamide N-methyase
VIPGYREEDLAIRDVLAGGRRIALRGPRVPPVPRDFYEPPGELRLPFWARLWPGGVALADFLLSRMASEMRGQAVIDLGCGLGCAGIAAGIAGASVTLSDGNATALAFAAANARANGVADARTLALDWTRPPPELPRHAVALAAEVLYDARAFEPLVRTLDAVLAPRGVAWIAEPERIDLAPFERAARAAGLELSKFDELPHPPGLPPVDGGPPRPVRLFRLARVGRTG